MVDVRVLKRGNEERPSKRIKFIRALITYGAAFVFGIFGISVMSYYNSNLNISPWAQHQSVQCPEPPKYWGVCLSDEKAMGIMNRIFDRLGYLSVNASEGDEWDVLWSIEFPFDTPRSEIFEPLSKPLKVHQLINHFPGMNIITSKSLMTTKNRDIKYILPGFILPRMIDEFKVYIAANPNARFVEKSLTSKDIKLVEKQEIKYDKSNKFYQHFMENPFLVDGHFMNFGVYVLISSISPLRVYRYAQEVHLRFCPEPYFPFDSKNLAKYVISDKHQDLMQFPGSKSHFDIYGYSNKFAIERYFHKKGHNVSELWRNIDEAITQLMLNNEENLLTEVCNQLSQLLSTYLNI